MNVSGVASRRAILSGTASGARSLDITAEAPAAHAAERERRVAASAPKDPVTVTELGAAPQKQQTKRIDVVAHDQPGNRIAECDDQPGLNRAVAFDQLGRASCRDSVWQCV